MAYITTAHLTNPLPALTFPIGEMLRTWLQRSRERTALAGMSELELHDIGLSPTSVRAELGKPFWRN